MMSKVLDTNKEPKRRKNEISGVLHREKMEQCPPDVDAERWDYFRTKYNGASELVRFDSPPQIDIELNATCNLKCSFCIQSIQDMGKEKLGFECFKEIVDIAVANGTYSLKLNYQNEPLILKDLERYIEYAKSVGMVNVFFSTNGILLNESRAESLIKSGLTKIFVSIDAVDNETYQIQRGAPVYDKIERNVRRFIEIRNAMNSQYPLVRVNFLKTQTNKGQSDTFIEKWDGLADMVIIQRMNELVDNTTDKFIEPDFDNFKCSFPYKQLVVRANGDILPCCPMNGIKHKIGHISEMSLRDAWNSEKMIYLQDLHRNGDYKKDDVCRHCIDGK